MPGLWWWLLLWVTMAWFLFVVGVSYSVHVGQWRDLPWMAAYLALCLAWPFLVAAVLAGAVLGRMKAGVNDGA